MTTQNTLVYRTTFLNIAQAGSPYYYPAATGLNADGYDHLTFRIQIVSGNVNNSVTATVESDDGVTWTFAWDESRGLWNWMTGARGTASWVANNSTVYARLLAFNHNARLWRVKLVIVDGGAAANSGIISVRGIKV